MVCLCGDGSVCLALLGTEIGSVFFNGIGLEDWSMTNDWHWIGGLALDGKMGCRLVLD